MFDGKGKSWLYILYKITFIVSLTHLPNWSFKYQFFLTGPLSIQICTF